MITGGEVINIDMYYRDKELENIMSSKSMAIYSILIFALMWISLISILCSYLIGSSSFLGFCGLFIVLLIIQFSVSSYNLIKLRKGYWFLVVSILVYTIFVGIFFVLFNYTQNINKSLFYTLILFTIFDFSTSFVQRKLNFFKKKVEGPLNNIYVIPYSDGREYCGELDDLEPNGKGRMTYPNGNIYEGIFKDGKPNGIMVVRMSNGDIYEGDMEDGLKCGYGKYI